ncbi:acyltransferase [Novosphingobium sp. KCTC 2891]|uniref:acyltransferase family protein n=1 Tax=Novosphingobium sp. KCTC 2891 TaxID=2989730 RepID=UPI002223680D|nr:acyltransferase [Novosphingobium sp. KCTC 2891]MCW1383291.1 acyltransferase [Novosphingobium sp. KCTC 2891]
MRRHDYAALDGLRGLAAFAVLLFHSCGTIEVGVGPPMTFLAVDFFFCLSGFVLAHAYGERLATGALSHAAFLKLRVQRLHPIIVLGVLLGLAAELAIGRISPGEAWANVPATVLLIPLGFAFRQAAYPLDNPLWSLAFEFSGGVLLGLLARAHTAVWIALAALGACGIAMLIAMGAGFDGLGFSSPKMFIGGFARLLLPFASGVALYRLQAARPATISAAWSFAGLGLLLFVYDFEGMVGTLVAVAILIPGIVALGANARPGRFDGVMRSAGRLSYPLYALHLPIVDTIATFTAGSAPGSASRWMLLGLALGLSVIVAVLAERWWERPGRAWLARRLPA